MINPARSSSSRGSGLIRLFAGSMILALSALFIGAAEARRNFDVPADSADRSLKTFSQQAGLEVIFSTKVASGVRTRNVRGEMTPRQALDQMLANTGLVVVQDPSTGAFSVRTETATEKNGQRAVPATSGGRPMGPGAADEAHAGTLGVVTGRISNEATGAYLEGAQVMLAGGSGMVLTDRQGRYRIQALPGDVILSVAYSGLEEKKLPVSVRSGETVNLDVGLTAGIYTLEPFRVEGEREGSAKALTSQQTAMNVKSVSATDSLGNIADGSAADFIHRLSGVGLENDGASAQRITIRGIGGALNNVTMDGEPIAAANSGTMTRAFEFDQASISMLGAIEVIKAPTPDMNANAIGGSVNMVTKSAFDRRDERLFLYTVAVVPMMSGSVRPVERRIAQPIKGIGPSVNFTYSDVVGREGKLGVLLTSSFYAQDEVSTASVLTFENTLNSPAYLRAVNLPRPIAITRIRANAGARFDYRFNERTQLSFHTQYNYAYSDQDGRTHTVSTGTALAQFNASGTRIGTGTIMPGYTDTFTRVLTGTASVSTLTMGALDKSGRTYQFQPSLLHRFDRGVLDFTASLSDSNNYYDSHGPDTRHLNTRLKGSVTARVANIAFDVDRAADLAWPVVTQTAGPDLYNLANYTALQLTDQTMMAEDNVASMRFNLRRQVDTDVPAFFKVGASFHQQKHHTSNSNTRFSYTGTNVGQFADNSDRFTGSVNRGYRRPPWIDAYRVANHVRDNPGLWTEDIAYKFTQRLQNERDLKESVTAAYVMGEVMLGDLGVMGGLRVEETRTQGEGARDQITPEEKARRAAWVGAVTPAELERRTIAQYSGRIQREGEYRNVFPGLHFRYAPAKGLVGRLSYSTSIGRPSINNIVPSVVANFDNEVVTATNPALRPQHSDNFDASVEYYFEPIGLLSAGVFLKEVSDFIYRSTSGVIGAGQDNGFDGDYEGFDLTTDLNGGSARYRGFELAYQQQFNFLPGFLKGFGVNANYTQLETRGDYGGTTTTTEIARFIPKTANIGLSYNRDRLTVQFNLNYRGHFLNAISTNPAATSYVANRFLLAGKFRYALTKKLSFFYDMDNVLKNTHITHYVVNRERPIQTRVYEPKVTVGFQGRF